MKRHILFASVLLASISAFAQNGNVTGVVVDKLGNPVSGALVEILNNKGKMVLEALQDKTIKGKVRKVRITKSEA